MKARNLTVLGLVALLNGCGHLSKGRCSNIPEGYSEISYSKTVNGKDGQVIDLRFRDFQRCENGNPIYERRIARYYSNGKVTYDFTEN